jgi:phosphohistidine swiveling domain-containing protein
VKTIVFDRDAADHPRIGGKARMLAALLPLADCSIPRWFVLTTDAHDVGLDGIEAELRAALAELCPNGELVAVRSSAADEDGRRHSFAGQLESFLDVPMDEVGARVEDVWRSGFSERVLAYRREHGLSDSPRGPAVLIQRMVRADAAGVAFGADPATGRRGTVVISAVRGSGIALVSGECDAETWRVTRDEGHRASITDDLAARPSFLTPPQVQAIAELVLAVGCYLGSPQDIEWAYEGTQLFLLQARPITTLGALADPDGVLSLWDNSNIAESYNGITTPLTFSFARRAYEEVYRQFCKLLRVPPTVLARNDNVFRNMLGLIRGRVYYNLLNWYRALAMLPGFTFNRRFMEQMMGVKEPLPESIVAELAKATWRDRLRDGYHLLISAGALLASHFTFERRKRRFLQRLDDALGTTRPDLSRWRIDELAAYYRDLERQLLPHWDAPLVNDFLAMIFFGLLRKSVTKWCGDAAANLQNNLLAGEGGMISAEPAVAIRAMAVSARSDAALVQTLCDGAVTDINRALQAHPVLRTQVDAYLDKFGERCLEELKLESMTLHDDPMLLFRSVGRLAASQEIGDRRQETAVRSQAEQRVRHAIRYRPLRRLLFGWLLRHARARVRDRENLRFERTRLFGRARQIVLELGRRLQEIDRLDDPRDVFYLEVNEILGFVEGTATCTDLRGLAALRKAEFARYQQMDVPAGRFETRGAVHQGNRFRGAAPVPSAEPSEQRQGLGCCAGVVRGVARVITDPRAATLHPGEILVAERTDPGWIMLFPMAAGIVVERGSLLSHSAIVARELGIPAVVSVPGVTAWLMDGDTVELDGSRGLVTRIARVEAADAK